MKVIKQIVLKSITKISQSVPKKKIKQTNKYTRTKSQFQSKMSWKMSVSVLKGI